jgi:alkanesulfonate monooxygenase SsuD/methylene tetrahydromethanopterin reductase-like flavin-dependent oxidoreductase (luciferase family)
VRIRLGTAIAQISARAPAATAMAAMSLDHLSGGRMVLGLGVSGPQVVEGWYGPPFAKPLARMREYISTIRAIWARQIYLAAEGPKNIAMAGELCDGWLALFCSPHHDGCHREALSEGLSRPSALRGADSFAVAAQVPFIATDDVDATLDAVRPFYALYFGGMGAKGANFHANVPIRMGYEAEIERVDRLYLAGHKREAAAALPRRLLEQLTLIGPHRQAPPRPAGVARVARHHAADRRRAGGSAPPPSSCSADLLGGERRVLRRALVLAVDLRSGRRRDRPVQQRIGGLDHPALQARLQVREHVRVGGIVN